MPDVLCSMCLDSLVQKSEEVLAAECGHLFHRKCLNKWQKRSCAECRNVISEAELKKIYPLSIEIDFSSQSEPSNVLLVKTNENLLSQIAENQSRIDELEGDFFLCKSELDDLTFESKEKANRIHALEKVLAERNKKIALKEQSLRALQIELKAAKTEIVALKKNGVETATKLADAIIEVERLRHAKQNNNPRISKKAN